MYAFMLSGFITTEAYKARRPDWEPHTRHFSEADAMKAAASWRESKGDEAVVEVLRLHANRGTVIAIVSMAGTETVG